MTDDADCYHSPQLVASGSASSAESVELHAEKHSVTRIEQGSPYAPESLDDGEQHLGILGELPSDSDGTKLRLVIPTMKNSDDDRVSEASEGVPRDLFDSSSNFLPGSKEGWSYSPVHSPDRFRDQGYYRRMQKLTEAAQAIDAVRSTGAFTHSTQGAGLPLFSALYFNLEPLLSYSKSSSKLSKYS